MSTQVQPTTKPKKPIWKRWWMIVIYVLVAIGIINSLGGDDGETTTDAVTQEPSASEMASAEEQAPEPTPEEAEEPEPTPEEVEEEAAEDNIPTEYTSALRSAERYSDMMHMSKAGIYDQITSEYGDQFSEEAGQYAIDNMEADWNANALEKAKTYQESMDMAPAAIHDQLTSEYGEQFTQEQADYAIANLP